MFEHSYTRDEMLRDNPIEDVVRSVGGLELKKRGSNLVCCCPFHKESTPSFTVSPGKGFVCFGCGAKGTVIDFVMRFKGMTVGEAMSFLTRADRKNNETPSRATTIAPEAKPSAGAPAADAKNQTLTATYSYADESGKEVYQALRYQSPNPEKPCGYEKTFRQRRKDGENWVWNMNGVRRVLYRLPRVIKAQHVWIVEGEKDADNLESLGYTATCNVGGAGKWLPEYAPFFKNKDVVLCGDNDPAGRAHVEMVRKSLQGVVRSLKVTNAPEPHKDISDLIDSARADGLGVDAIAEKIFNDLVMTAKTLPRGVDMPIKSMAQLEAEYIEVIAKARAGSMIKLNQLFPSWSVIRPFVGGEMILVMAGTGVGKTILAQAISIALRPAPVLFFEVELTGAFIFERFAGMSLAKPGESVWTSYWSGQSPAWRQTGKLEHIYVCDQSKITTDNIEAYIEKAEIVMSKRPQLVVVDYLGLIQGKGMSRYDRFSTIAEDFKVLFKRTGTVGLLTSQVQRKGQEDSPEITLTDAKESGSIENSSTVVFGCWRDPEDSSVVIIKTLKDTRGRPGREVRARLDENLILEEISPVD